MKIWLDDTRPAPEGWIWARTYDEVMDLIIGPGYKLGEPIEEINFDHDLGEDKTGYDVASYIEYMATYGHIGPLKWAIHSANPVGRQNIERAMKKAEKAWNTVKLEITKDDLNHLVNLLKFEQREYGGDPDLLERLQLIKEGLS